MKSWDIISRCLKHLKLIIHQCLHSQSIIPFIRLPCLGDVVAQLITVEACKIISGKETAGKVLWRLTPNDATPGHRSKGFKKPNRSSLDEKFFHARIDDSTMISENTVTAFKRKLLATEGYLAVVPTSPEPMPLLCHIMLYRKFT